MLVIKSQFRGNTRLLQAILFVYGMFVKQYRHVIATFRIVSEFTQPKGFAGGLYLNVSHLVGKFTFQRLSNCSPT